MFKVVNYILNLSTIFESMFLFQYKRLQRCGTESSFGYNMTEGQLTVYSREGRGAESPIIYDPSHFYTFPLKNTSTFRGAGINQPSGVLELTIDTKSHGGA